MGNRVVSQAIPKVDYKALVTGKAVYTDDLAAKDSLVVKVLRSPHAHALIQDINLTRAELVPDIECILTYKDWTSGLRWRDKHIRSRVLMTD